mmetsp:Transcript_18555/g.42654  ORF Transcript_18555/g.42654 Transcript_18555/m.42654 type:complete len:435 (-) Transcript_18555:337-1641(-)
MVAPLLGLVPCQEIPHQFHAGIGRGRRVGGAVLLLGFLVGRRGRGRRRLFQRRARIRIRLRAVLSESRAALAVPHHPLLIGFLVAQEAPHEIQQIVPVLLGAAALHPLPLVASLESFAAFVGPENPELEGHRGAFRSGIRRGCGGGGVRRIAAGNSACAGGHERFSARLGVVAVVDLVVSEGGPEAGRPAALLALRGSAGRLVRGRLLRGGLVGRRVLRGLAGRGAGNGRLAALAIPAPPGGLAGGPPRLAVCILEAGRLASRCRQLGVASRGLASRCGFRRFCHFCGFFGLVVGSLPGRPTPGGPGRILALEKGSSLGLDLGFVAVFGIGGHYGNRANDSLGRGFGVVAADAVGFIVVMVDITVVAAAVAADAASLGRKLGEFNRRLGRRVGRRRQRAGRIVVIVVIVAVVFVDGAINSSSFRLQMVVFFVVD